MTTTPLASDPAAYFARLEPHLFDFSPEDQETARAIYHELAKGAPVDDEQLANALGVGLDETRARRERWAVKCFTRTDADNRILGFGGLDTERMHHEIVVRGRSLWTWCAWDTLFIPEMLDTEVEVVSSDPRTQNVIRLTITPDGVRDVSPPGTVVSFVHPEALVTDSAENVMATFCHHVYFFESPESGIAWAQDRPGALIFALPDAVDLARRLNTWNFGNLLGRE